MTGLMEVLSDLRANDDAEMADLVADLLNGFIKCRRKVTGSGNLTGEDIRRFAEVVDLNLAPAANTAKLYAPKTAQRNPLMAPSPGGSILARTTASLRSASAVSSGAPLPDGLMGALEQSLHEPRMASG